MLKKIIILLLVAVLALAVYFIYNKKPVGEIGNKIEKIEKVDTEKLENNYKAEVKLIFARFLVLAGRDDLSVLELRQVRDELLELKVPTKFKDLHLGFALAISRLENFLSGGDDKEKEISRDIIKKIKQDYDWIN